jgi:hypothetical protein
MPLGKPQRPLGFSETAGRGYPGFRSHDSAFRAGVTAPRYDVGGTRQRGGAYSIQSFSSHQSSA